MPNPQMEKYQRASQLWSLLVLAARTQQVLSYRVVERLTGIDRRGVGGCLGPILHYCNKQNLPALTSIVLKEDTGLPGEGFTAVPVTDIFKEQARVFIYDWFSKPAPNTEDFRKADTERSRQMQEP